MANKQQTPSSPQDSHPVGSHDGKYWVKGTASLMTLPDSVVQDTKSPSGLACVQCESGLCQFTMRGNPKIMGAFVDAFEQQVIPKWSIKTPADLSKMLFLIMDAVNSVLTAHTFIPPIKKFVVINGEEDPNSPNPTSNYEIDLSTLKSLDDLPKSDGAFRAKTMGSYTSDKHKMGLSVQTLMGLQPHLIYFLNFINTIYHECRHAEQRFWQANFMGQNGFGNVGGWIDPIVFDAAANASEKITKTHPYYRCVLRWYASTYGVPDSAKWKQQNPDAERIVQAYGSDLSQGGWHNNAWIYDEKDPRSGKPLIESMDINIYNTAGTYKGMAANGMDNYLQLPEEEDGKATGQVISHFIGKRLQERQQEQASGRNTPADNQSRSVHAKHK